MTAKEKIKKIRSKTGLSQRAFSEHFGIPTRTLENWEDGSREPAEYIINLLAFQIAAEETLLRKRVSQVKTFAEGLLSDK